MSARRPLGLLLAPPKRSNTRRVSKGFAPSTVPLLLILLHQHLLAAAQVQQINSSTISVSQAFISSAGGRKAVFAPDVAFDGEPLALVSARNDQGCAQACRENDDCGYFNYCKAQEGCELPDNWTLAYQECVLYNGSCTLIPPVAATSADSQAGVTAGFPLLYPQVPELAVAIKYEAQGMVGGDFDCPDSVIPGMCAIRSVFVAVPACINSFSGICTAVVVYARGMDGCGQEIAVLKQTRLVPSNSFMSPTVYTLVVEERAPTGSYLLYNEGTVIGANDPAPSGAPAAAATPNTSSTAAVSNGTTNVTTWYGCILATIPAVVNGDIVAVLDGIASPEACCRECRARAPACNVWNGCFNRSEACSYKDLSQEVVLQPGQCQLRKQALADPDRGGPPYLLAKGDSANGMSAGIPIATAPGPELPGYTRYIAGGLFGQPGYKCNSTIQAVLQECILRGTPQQLADDCTQDARCVAFIWKDLFWMEGPGAAFLRGQEGAEISRMVRTATSTTYYKQAAAAAAAGTASSADASTSTSTSTSDGGGLSAGAIAGIAVGAAVVAIAALLGGCVLLRRRRQQQGSGARTVAPAASAVSGKTEEGGDSVLLQLAPSPNSWQDRKPSEQRSVLSTPQGSGVTAIPAAAAASLGTSSGSDVGVATPTARMAGPARLGTLASTGSGSVVLGHAVIGRPVAPSPFAAARQLRVAASISSRSSSAAGAGSAQASMEPSLSWGPTNSMGFPSLPGAARAQRASPAATVGLECGPEVHVELPQVMTELMQQRAAEEQAALAPVASLPSSHPGEGPTSLTASGGSTSTSNSPLASATLPSSLLTWLIPRKEVEYHRRPDGELAVLGEGASGRVIRATYNGETVAAKEIEIGRGIEVQEVFLTEAKHMQALRHPNIVTFYGCVLDVSKGILLMELMDGRDLGSALRLRNAQGQRVFGWYKHGCRVAWEVAKALNYLHARNFVHMDVKASNVLLSCRGQAKLGDVGLARLQTRTCLSDLPSLVGTFAWVAPEVLMGGRNCNQAIDIYSFGVLLWELITGERPVRGHLRAPLVPAECPQEVADLMDECGALDPTERPTAQQCLLRLQAMLAAQQRGGG